MSDTQITFFPKANAISYNSKPVYLFVQNLISYSISFCFVLSKISFSIWYSSSIVSYISSKVISWHFLSSFSFFTLAWISLNILILVKSIPVLLFVNFLNSLSTTENKSVGFKKGLTTNVSNISKLTYFISSLAKFLFIFSKLSFHTDLTHLK